MNKQANAILITLLVIVGIIVIAILAVMGTYNSLVQKDVAVEKAWGNVQSAYQRRLDLIPNLVETVKFEEDTQTKIAALRSGITSATTPAQLSAAKFKYLIYYFF